MTSKQVLISGGTSGIGRAIAVAFAARGDQVVATGVSQAEVDAAGRDKNDAPIRNELLDVRSGEQIARLIATLSRLDVLVNCSGIIRRGGAEHDPAVFAEVLDVNLTGAMRLCTAARPLLKESGGCVLNTASMLSYFGSGAAPAYSASKGGIAQLTKSLAIAWAADGIRVNAIAPGWIETPLTQALTADPARRQAIIDRTPLARWGRSEDVAGAALFLCSPAAAFITGVILPVDGGYSIA
ncbi:MAG: SDR family NAD(P)-dependent oxidoreductase [Pirellulaceae bacterium]